MKTGKIKLQKFLYKCKIPNVEDARCGCRREEETMRHILMECPRFREMRKRIWAQEVRKARLNWIEFCKILTTPAYVKKTALFILKIVLLGQFRGLTWSEPIKN